MIYDTMDTYTINDVEGNEIVIPRPELLTPSSSNRKSQNDMRSPKITSIAKKSIRKHLVFPPTSSPLTSSVSSSPTTGETEASCGTSSSKTVVMLKNDVANSCSKNPTDTEVTARLQLLKSMHEKKMKEMLDMENKMQAMQHELQSLRAARKSAERDPFMETESLHSTRGSDESDPVVQPETLCVTNAFTEPAPDTQTAEPSWIQKAKNRTFQDVSFVCCMPDCGKQLTADAKPDGTFANFFRSIS